jgi:hypothetical protein
MPAGHAGSLYIAPQGSGQWRAMREGNGGFPGNGGNVVSVTYRF